MDTDDMSDTDVEFDSLGFGEEQLKGVDKNLPRLKRLSLDEWCETWTRLNSLAQRESRDIFALTGHFTDVDGQRRRAQLDLSSHRAREHHRMHQHCDIDSVIGVVLGDFPILEGAVLKYFMLHNVTHTLDSDLHIPPVTVVDEDGRDKRVFPHMVPNMRFIEMEPRAIIRAFFPLASRNSNQNNCLNEGQMRELYDLAVRPAATETLPHELHFNWPATYDDEKFRAENSGRAGAGDAGEGRVGGRTAQQSGRDIHVEYLNAWVARIRDLVNGSPHLGWARSFFFVVEMRGLKNNEVSIHAAEEEPAVDDAGVVDEEAPRVQAVDGVLEYFNTNEFAPGCWFLDIATNVAVSDDLNTPLCAFASTRMHAEILNRFLSEDMEQCERWVAGHGGYYQRDEVAHLQDVAGFRFTNPNWDENGVHYIQVYTSEKSVTYNLDSPNKAKRTSPFKLLNDWDRARKSHFLPLSKAYRDSSKTHSVVLRIESRVDFIYVARVHLLIPEDMLQGWLYCIDNIVFWGWKLYRLLSIYNILIMLMHERATFTLQQLPECGSLLIMLSWMANALVNRPDEGSHWDEVRDSGSVHRLAGGQLVPHQPLGAFHLHSLHLKPNRLPRISSLRTVSKDTIVYLLRSADKSLMEMDIYNLFVGVKPPAPKVAEQDPWREREGEPQPTPTFRYANKQRIVRVTNAERVVDQFVGAIPEAERDERYSSEDEDYEERQRPTLRSQVLTDIIFNYPIQMFAKAPNRRLPVPDKDGNKETSWCSLTPKQMAEVKFEIFCSTERLGDAFKSHVIFGYEVEKWNGTVATLFPTLEEARTKTPTQGLDTLKVYTQFLDLLISLSPDEQANVVSQARQFVSERWAWLPYGASKSHLWASGTRNVPKYATQVKEKGGLDGGPWIILNPARIG
ncbi:hypothetical protein FRC08_014404 [Ceratobasidium sp. 394]|nr:hypothetical protein FRC08_014404 [Ceratobasidium sp. 394]KAG9102128.1 hypothetical protein FS749_015711 [Ceratobasidium sp. UAMH 11750]